MVRNDTLQPTLGVSCYERRVTGSYISSIESESFTSSKVSIKQNPNFNVRYEQTIDDVIIYL